MIILFWQKQNFVRRSDFYKTLPLKAPRALHHENNRMKTMIKI